MYDLFERGIDYRDHVNNSMIVIRKKPVYLSNFVNVLIISCIIDFVSANTICQSLLIPLKEFVIERFKLWNTVF